MVSGGDNLEASIPEKGAWGLRPHSSQGGWAGSIQKKQRGEAATE